MQYEFSTVVGRTTCHIRSFGSGIDPAAAVNDRPHKHFFMEFHCVFAGEETVYLPNENAEYRLIPGKILLLPRGVYHGVTTKNGTVERLCFNFSAESGEKENSPILELYQNIDQVMVFEDPDVNGILRQCRQLRLQKEDALSEERQGLLLLSAVFQLLSRVSGSRQLDKRPDSHTLRQKWIIEEYIESNFTKDTGLEGLAQALYLSQRQTRKLVQQFMGEDFKSIIIRRRMELAEIYLRDPEKTLEEIAWQVGYRSYSGFQLCFKKYFGVTPSAYREKV